MADILPAQTGMICSCCLEGVYQARNGRWYHLVDGHPDLLLSTEVVGKVVPMDIVRRGRKVETIVIVYSEFAGDRKQEHEKDTSQQSQ